MEQGCSFARFNVSSENVLNLINVVLVATMTLQEYAFWDCNDVAPVRQNFADVDDYPLHLRRVDEVSLGAILELLYRFSKVDHLSLFV